MRGFGTIINTLAVVLGGLIGIGLRSGLSEKMQTTLMQACGIATIFIGVSGTLAQMLTVSQGVFSTRGTMILILSLVLGGLLGEWIDLESRMESVGERIKAAVRRENDSRFVEGFVNVSLIICVGAMAIVGSIEDGISGDYTMLMAKAVLDMIIVLVFAASYGLGALCSGIAIFVYQGAITLVAAFCGSFVGDTVIHVLSFVGSALIFCVGVNICFQKQIRVGNLLPALPVAVVLQVLSDALQLGWM